MRCRPTVFAYAWVENALTAPMNGDASVPKPGFLKRARKGKIMIYAEVVRLRKLRNVALRARAFAKALESNSIDGAVFAQCALACWNIARIASGTLRAHPYLSYQQGPSRMRALADQAIAWLAGFSARRRRRSATVCALELQCVAREVSDVRALTWLPDLSDALGRIQLRLRRLTTELDVGAQRELDAVPKSAVVGTEMNDDALDEIGPENSWPYLAI